MSYKHTVEGKEGSVFLEDSGNTLIVMADPNAYLNIMQVQALIDALKVWLSRKDVRPMGVSFE